MLCTPRPIKKETSGRTLVEWKMDLVDSRRPSLVKFKSYPTVDSLRDYKKEAKEVSNALIRMKRENLKDFVSSTDPSRPLLSNFQIMKKLRNRFYSSNPSSVKANSPVNNKRLIELSRKSRPNTLTTRNLYLTIARIQMGSTTDKPSRLVQFNPTSNIVFQNVSQTF